jgi:1,4-alpha-glucan branching enzyme
MIALAQKHRILSAPAPRQLWEHNDDKTLIFLRKGLVFAFNFHPDRSWTEYAFSAPPGRYRIVLDSDDGLFGGHQRVDSGLYYFTSASTPSDGAVHRLSLYLPSRTALVLEKVE